jgi:hypothetical protein
MNDKLITAAAQFLKDNDYSGWTQSTNAKFFLQCVCKMQAAKATQEQLLFLMNVAGNASAFRQRLIKAGVITGDAVTTRGGDILGDLAL